MFFLEVSPFRFPLINDLFLEEVGEEKSVQHTEKTERRA